MTNKLCAISVEDVHKEFVLPQYKSQSIKQAFIGIFRRRKAVKQKVLDGVTFSVNKGDFFGIVGRNGSGKSTLLKILAGVYYPTSGSVKVNGKLTPFIELGVGFNPELSGRDNVFLNGALLGFSRKEMQEMYDEIVAFAELEQFMGQKLKNFSSGMQVRLAFAIAIKAKNEVLVFDEVLAVGDEAFQRKCYDIFEQYKANGQTVILVSHDMNAIRTFCNRAILVSNGKIIEEGNPQDVAKVYSRLNQESIDSTIQNRNSKRAKEQQAPIMKISVTNKSGNESQSFKPGAKAYFRVHIEEAEPARYESIGLTIVKQSGEHIGGLNSRVYSGGSSWKNKARLALEVQLDFMPGKYYVLAEVFSKPGVLLESYHGPIFEVKPGNLDWSGLTKLRANWVEANE